MNRFGSTFYNCSFCSALVYSVTTEADVKSVFSVSKKDIVRFSFGCNDYCGEWITKRAARKNGKKKASRLRIVGGRRVINPRPWMALIEMTSNQGNILFCFISCLIEKKYFVIFLYLMV